MMKFTTGALVLTSLLAVATSASAQEIDVRSMDEACRTDPTLIDRCHIIPASYASSMTLWQLSVEFAAPFGIDPHRVMESLIHFNGWHGATKDLVIPAGVAFRAA